jgi:hypothetical protein
MKKLLLIIIVSLFLFCFTGCSPNSPHITGYTVKKIDGQIIYLNNGQYAGQFLSKVKIQKATNTGEKTIVNGIILVPENSSLIKNNKNVISFKKQPESILLIKIDEKFDGMLITFPKNTSNFIPKLPNNYNYVWQKNQLSIVSPKENIKDDNIIFDKIPKTNENIPIFCIF